MSSSKFSGKQLLLRTMAIAVVLVAIFYFLLTAYTNLQEIPSMEWSPWSLVFGFLSLILVVGGVALLASIWRLLSSKKNHRLSFWQAQEVVALSQLGKYLPGNIGQHVGRVALSKKYGIGLDTALPAMLVEMILGVSVAGILGAFSVIWTFGGSTIGVEVNGFYVLAGAIVLLVAPWMAIFVVNSLFGRVIKKFTNRNRIEHFSVISVFQVVAIYSGCFLLFGIIIKMQSFYFFDMPQGNVFQFSCLFALAWVAGYLLPGAPGGLGVRESVMILLISPVVGEGTAVALSVSLRITTTLGDGVAFIYGLIVRQYLNSQIIKS